MIKEKKYILLLVLLTAILLITPSIIRIINNNHYSINSESYYNMRLYNQDSTSYDSLQGRSIPFNIINMIRLDDVARQILFKIIPILLGIATIILEYFILKKQNISEKTILAIITFTIISPVFIYTFTDYKIYSFVIFIDMLGIFFLTNNKILLSSITFAIIPFIDVLSGILTFVLLLIYQFNNRKNKILNRINSTAILAGIILSIIINTYFGYSIKHVIRFYIHNILTDIGANIGISFSIIILATIGLILLWEDGWRNFVTYILLMLLIVLAIFNDSARIYINFIIMIYAGFAFIYLNKRKWSISIIKKTTILLIICSIFFSTLVYTANSIRSEPTPEYIDALIFLKNQSLPTETILCSPENGYLIEYYTERMILVDESTTYYDKSKYEVMETIASSRNLEKTEKLLKEYNIKYIVISDKFESYLNEKEGLLFLIETSGKFTNIITRDTVKIWMYTG
jgi:hypothetical protein